MSDMAVAWLLIGGAVWSVTIGAVLVSCWAEDCTEAEYEALENDQWQRDHDEIEALDH